MPYLDYVLCIVKGSGTPGGDVDLINLFGHNYCQTLYASRHGNCFTFSVTLWILHAKVFICYDYSSHLIVITTENFNMD